MTKWPSHEGRRSHLGIRANGFEAVAVDATGEVAPERVSDHATETGHGVLRQASFIEHDRLLPVIAGEGELLQEVGEHVGATDLVRESAV